MKLGAPGPVALVVLASVAIALHAAQAAAAEGRKVKVRQGGSRALEEELSDNEDAEESRREELLAERDDLRAQLATKNKEFLEQHRRADHLAREVRTLESRLRVERQKERQEWQQLQRARSALAQLAAEASAGATAAGSPDPEGAAPPAAASAEEEGAAAAGPGPTPAPLLGSHGSAQPLAGGVVSAAPVRTAAPSPAGPGATGDGAPPTLPAEAVAAVALAVRATREATATAAVVATAPPASFVDRGTHQLQAERVRVAGRVVQAARAVSTNGGGGRASASIAPVSGAGSKVPVALHPPMEAQAVQARQQVAPQPSSRTVVAVSAAAGSAGTSPSDAPSTGGSAAAAAVNASDGYAAASLGEDVLVEGAEVEGSESGEVDVQTHDKAVGASDFADLEAQLKEEDQRIDTLDSHDVDGEASPLLAGATEASKNA